MTFLTIFGAVCLWLITCGYFLLSLGFYKESLEKKEDKSDQIMKLIGTIIAAVLVLRTAIWLCCLI